MREDGEWKHKARNRTLKKRELFWRLDPKVVKIQAHSENQRSKGAAGTNFTGVPNGIPIEPPRNNHPFE